MANVRRPVMDSTIHTNRIIMVVAMVCHVCCACGFGLFLFLFLHLFHYPLDFVFDLLKAIVLLGCELDHVSMVGVDGDDGVLRKSRGLSLNNLTTVSLTITAYDSVNLRGLYLPFQALQRSR